MPKTFAIELDATTNRWVPTDPAVRDEASFPNDGTLSIYVRRRLFAYISFAHPGEYELVDDIEDVRGEVLARVDRRSDELLKGFTFDGIVFSLSEKAQIRYEYMDRTADTLPYPLPINSLDDRDMLVLTEPEQTHAFCKASTVHVLTVIGSGTQQKNIIRAATTVEELQAYVDPR